MDSSTHVWKILKLSTEFNWKKLWWSSQWVAMRYREWQDMSLPCYPPYKFNTKKEATAFVTLKKFEE